MKLTKGTYQDGFVISLRDQCDTLVAQSFVHGGKVSMWIRDGWTTDPIYLAEWLEATSVTFREAIGGATGEQRGSGGERGVAQNGH